MQNIDLPAQLQQRLPSLADMTPIVPLQRQLLAASLAMLAPDCDLPPNSMFPDLKVQLVLPYCLRLSPLASVTTYHNKSVWGQVEKDSKLATWADWLCINQPRLSLVSVPSMMSSSLAWV